MWAWPFIIHVLAVAAVLLVALAVSRPGFAFSADEGVVAYQVELLATEGRWQHPYGVEDLDPTGAARPFPRGERAGDEVVPYAKHPLYPFVLVPASRVGGVVGMLVVSTLGTLAAAVLTARVAAGIRPGLARPALWITGFASPLFFDGLLLLAHSVAAAAIAAAAWSGARLLGGTPHRARWAVCLAVSVGVAVALRSEALLVGAGFVVGALAVWWLRRERRAPAVTIVAAASVGTLVAWISERVAYRAIVGGSRAVPRAEGVAVDFWDARFTSFGITWFEGTSGRMTVTSVLLTASVVVLGVAVVAHRLGRLPEATASVVLVLAVIAYASHLGIAPHRAVPGLMVAFPLLWVGLLLVDRETFATDLARLIGVAGAFVVIAVLLTQYPQGGGAEWGGRFFAVALPLLIPVALESLRLAGRRLPSSSVLWRVAAPVAVVSTLVIALGAMTALRAAHDRADELGSAVVAAAARADSVEGSQRPVVVTTSRLLPQLLYPTLGELEWMVPTPDRLDALLERMRSHGLDRVVLVTEAASDPVEPSDGSSRRSVDVTSAGFRVGVVDLRDRSPTM